MSAVEDFRDIPAAPRVTSAATLWVMFVVMVLAMSAVVWMNPGPEQEAASVRTQRCWPHCPPAGSARAAEARRPAAQATVRPPATPGSHSSV